MKPRCSACVSSPNNVSNPSLAKQKKDLSLTPVRASLSVSPPPPLPLLLKLISSDVTELWKPWAEVLQMLCHHAKHGRKRTPRQLSDAAWEIGDGALPRHRLFDFSLYLSFQRHWQTVLCLPCSAGLVLIPARESPLAGNWWHGKGERKGERRMPRGNIPGSNDV